MDLEATNTEQVTNSSAETKERMDPGQLRRLVKGYRKCMTWLQNDTSTDYEKLPDTIARSREKEYWQKGKELNRLGDQISQFGLVGAINSGMSETPPKGFARLYRGSEWPWDPNKNLPNSYWIEDFAVALDYAGEGDVVACDVPESKIHRIKDNAKEKEIQIADPVDTQNAKIIARNLAVRDDKGALKRISFKSLKIWSLLTGNRHMYPKVYSKLYEDYVKSLEMNPEAEE